MRLLIIDNYDSFTFNLYQYIGEITTFQKEFSNAKTEIIVKRNREITLNDIRKIAPDKIIISPGPGSPEGIEYFGVCSDTILQLGKTTPILGVCLGMQGIAYCFGGKIIKNHPPVHGKTSTIIHNRQALFNGICQDIEVMRYHSLKIEASSLPSCLEVTAVVRGASHTSNDMTHAALNGQEIMGIRHKKYPIHGVQFHPESFLTERAHSLLKNFLLQN